MSGPECQWALTTAPVLEPFTVEEAKAQIRSVQDREDGLVFDYIRAARQACEDYLGRGLLTQTWTLNLSDFATVIPLPMAAPLASVTHVKYYDEDGTQQTLATTYYNTDTRSRPGRIALAADQTWPALHGGRNVQRVEIQYVVGYTTTALIPASIRQGMRIYIGYLDADRNGLEPGGKAALEVARLFWTDRVFWVPPQFEVSA